MGLVSSEQQKKKMMKIKIVFGQKTKEYKILKSCLLKSGYDLYKTLSRKKIIEHLI